MLLDLFFHLAWSILIYHLQVGARPTGIVLAIALLKHGIESRIIDQSSDTVEQPGNTLLLHVCIFLMLATVHGY